MARKVTLAGRFRKRHNAAVSFRYFYGNILRPFIQWVILAYLRAKRHRESRKARITKKPAFIKASFLILQNEVRGISPDEPSCAGSFC